MSALRGRIHELVARAGIDVERVPRRGTLERALREVLRQHHVELVVDIGANTGQFGAELRSVCRYRGRIVSVEPSTAPLAQLRDRAAADGAWEVRHHAVSERAGHVELREFDDSQFNSLLDPSADGRAYNEVLGAARVTDVPSTTLLALLDDVGATTDLSRTLVKTDTQGFDLVVLRSGMPRLAEVAAILLEAPIVGLYDGSFSIDEALEFVRSSGFHVFGIYPNSIDRRSGAVVDANLLATRTPAIAG